MPYQPVTTDRAYVLAHKGRSSSPVREVASSWHTVTVRGSVVSGVDEIIPLKGSFCEGREGTAAARVNKLSLSVKIFFVSGSSSLYRQKPETCGSGALTAGVRVQPVLSQSQPQRPLSKLLSGAPAVPHVSADCTNHTLLISTLSRTSIQQTTGAGPGTTHSGSSL